MFIKTRSIINLVGDHFQKVEDCGGRHVAVGVFSFVCLNVCVHVCTRVCVCAHVCRPVPCHFSSTHLLLSVSIFIVFCSEFQFSFNFRGSSCYFSLSLKDPVFSFKSVKDPLFCSGVVLLAFKYLQTLISLVFCLSVDLCLHYLSVCLSVCLLPVCLPRARARVREPLPGQLDSTLDQFQRLLVLRCLRPDRLTHGLQDFVSEQLGERFIETQVGVLGAGRGTCLS